MFGGLDVQEVGGNKCEGKSTQERGLKAMNISKGVYDMRRRLRIWRKN